ncbi:hypothetical protein V5799_012882 [Amblyomma americanum]|uniref:Lipocalin-6 1 n=1 Tax=Amblyomma americanum TaxID=6943 RepID=A0AAQ4E7I6_AMBAM
MAVFNTLIFCACIFKALAKAPDAGPPTSTETQLDGYELLAEHTTFRLAQTTFHLQDNNTHRCITVTVKNKTNEDHTVTLEVNYNAVNQDDWRNYSQRFKFEPEGSEYNIMKIVDGSGSPPGTYKFLYRHLDCTVIEVVESQRHDGSIVELIEREADSVPKGKERGNCMLWVNNAKDDIPDETCYKIYDKHCPELTVREGFSKRKCGLPFLQIVSEKATETK